MASAESGCAESGCAESRWAASGAASFAASFDSVVTDRFYMRLDMHCESMSHYMYMHCDIHMHADNKVTPTRRTSHEHP
ncbi:hypothetical protein GCM10009587_29300 [Microbacterium maritypicum]